MEYFIRQLLTSESFYTNSFIRFLISLLLTLTKSTPFKERSAIRKIETKEKHETEENTKRNETMHKN